MAPKTLLDTDILSQLMRKTPTVLNRARAYLLEHGLFSISIITRFEILRGLRVKQAMVQLTAFNGFCAGNEIVPVDEKVIDRAADIYADLYSRGQLIPDADILIAATAREHDLALATNNLRDFGRISGLTIDNWLH